MMKRIFTILATALVASTLLTGVAEARGGGGGGHMGGGGFGGHMGGGGFGGHMGGGIGHIGGAFGGHIGGGRIGGVGRIGGGFGERLGGVGRVGSLVHVDHPYGFHGMRHFGRFRNGLYGYDPYCYLPYETATIPPYCS